MCLRVFAMCVMMFLIILMYSTCYIECIKFRMCLQQSEGQIDLDSFSESYVFSC